MQLRSVTYSSFAAPGLQPIELEQILRTSTRNNARQQITGILMFNGAAFVQSIEGPPASVDWLLMELATDQRHCDVIIRDDRFLGRRVFPGWSMGYLRLDGGWLEGQYDIVEALSRDMPDPMHEILMSLATTLPFA